MYKESASYLREHIGGREPAILLILGSGLTYMADLCEDSVSIMYADIPGFKASTAPGHEGRLVFGDICGRHVMVMQGRMHCYEGYSAAEVTYPISVARALGVEMLVVTCATGGVNEDYNVGDIMMISDHIKLMGDSPLRGKNNDELGVRFPDMTYAYTPKLRETARECAYSLGITLREGVLFYSSGPQYETPAEIRAMRILGADAVCMSTAPEVIAASHMGIKTLGFSLISNMASGILDKTLSCEEVIAAGVAARPRFEALILECIKNLGGAQ